MIKQVIFSGQGISLKHRATLLPITSFFRTTWAHFPWPKMATFRVQNVLNTSRRNISLFATIIAHESSIFDTALQNSCGLTYLPSHFREPNFAFYALSSWIVRLIIAKNLLSFHLLFLPLLRHPQFPKQNLSRPLYSLSINLFLRWSLESPWPRLHRGGVLGRRGWNPLKDICVPIPIPLTSPLRRPHLTRKLVGGTLSFHVERPTLRSLCTSIEIGSWPDRELLLIILLISQFPMSNWLFE